MTDEARLQRWLDSQQDGGAHLAAAHVDVDTLVRYATGRLSPSDARAVVAHLDACEDGRCPEYVRSQQVGPESAGDWSGTSDGRAADDTRPRTFRSREIVWATFESMARELEVPIDELVNEAMATYAEARGYGGAGRTAADEVDDLARTQARHAHARPDPRRPPSAPPSRVPAHAEPPPMPRPPLSRPATPSRLPPPSRHGIVSRPPLPPPSRGAPPLPRAPAPPPRVPPPEARSLSPRVPPSSDARLTASRAPSSAEPTRQRAPMTQRMPDSPRDRLPPSRNPASTRQLVLEYEGNAYPVDKDRFLIGRSKTQADLRLDDPNVSRQHAVIERVGAAWYIVDLGSTNGILIAGERVARRALTDADVITITTHRIRCVFR